MAVYWKPSSQVESEPSGLSRSTEQSSRPTPFFERYLENPFKVRTGLRAGMKRRGDVCTAANSCTLCNDEDDN